MADHPPQRTWDILIATIPHRREKLVTLLAELARQMEPNVGVLVYGSPPVSMGGPPLGEKIRKLASWSRSAYVCTLDDDDWVAADYIPAIMTALYKRPDYVGFPVSYLKDGELQIPVDHSLRHGRWVNYPDLLVRDISDLNPMRRDIFTRGNFMGSLPGHPPGGHGNDRRWADSIRESGLLKTEEYIPLPMYYYRYSSSDNYVTERGDLGAPALPDYPWLSVIYA